MKNIFDDEIPLGFGMALAENPAAMLAYTNLSKSEKQRIIQQAKTASSKGEMRNIVLNLTNRFE